MWTMARAVLAAILLVAVAASAPTTAAEPDTLFCGTLTVHERSSATAAGSVTIGTRTIRLAAEPLYSSHPGTQERLRIGTAICFSATFNAAGEAFQYLVDPMGAEICGRVHAVSASGVRLEVPGIGTFPVRAGADLGPARYPPQTCFGLEVGPRGDAVITGRVLTVADRVVAHLLVCGRVHDWTAPTRSTPASLRHESEGRITIGSRPYVIAAGTIYSLVNQAPAVGEPTCLSGRVDSAGRIIDYAAQPGMPDAIRGSAVEGYLAPTATADGLIRFGSSLAPITPESYRFRIPAGTPMPEGAADEPHDFTLQLDERGDAIVTGARPHAPAVGWAGGPPQIPSLPSTSTR